MAGRGVASRGHGSHNSAAESADSRDRCYNRWFLRLEAAHDRQPTSGTLVRIRPESEWTGPIGFEARLQGSTKVGTVSPVPVSENPLRRYCVPGPVQQLGWVGGGGVGRGCPQ